MSDEVAAHRQIVTNHYLVAYEEHEPRADDPHKRDFDEWKRRQKAEGKWRCAWAAEVDDDSECDLSKPLEAHHSHLELALKNNISWEHLEHLYPGISDPDTAGAWIDGDQNLILYCAFHHRAVAGGVHHLDAAMWEASKLLKPGTLQAVPHAESDRGEMKRLAVAVAAACLGWLAGAFWPTHTASAACNQFNEALYLVGFAAPGTTPWQGVDNPDPSFGASSGFGTGFHGNQPQNSILDSVILKSTAGRDANESASVSTQTAVPGGYEMFLALGVAGPALSDMEAQVEVSYLPAERTAWFGAEVNSLSNGQKAVTWSVPSSITVTSVTLSASLAPLAGC